MSKKNIEAVLKGADFHMVGDGFRMANYIPGNKKPGLNLSPFIMLDYHPPFDYKPSKKPRGVGVHPHRGFETVTLSFKGSVAHTDSTGSEGVINPGDVQWMTAASGILHTEYHEENFAKEGGTMHMLQLWVNLPKAYKMTAPKYQTLLADEMGKVALPDNGGVVSVIAGEYAGVKGPAATFTPINMYRVFLNKGHKVSFTLAQQHNSAVLIAGGILKVNNEKDVSENDFVVFDHSGSVIELEALENAQFIVLSGEPINEPVVQYGPFVMNTAEEINEAIDDFNAGKFGVLKD